MQRAGELILQAVDSLEINLDVLRDDDFIWSIITSLDFPADLPAKMLPEQTADELLALFERLAPEQGAENSNRDRDPEGTVTETHNPPSVTIVNNGKRKRYSSPKLYRRDEWIYKNIHLHDYQTLSEKFKRIASSKKWKLISGRNSFKLAADRYAHFREIAQRRFPDDRPKESS